jgi:alpha-ribazole phosphatase
MKSAARGSLQKSLPMGALMTRLLLVRHGIARLQDAPRFWGKTDIPLSETGVRQAEQLRDRLSRLKIDAIYTSTLLRAGDTAEIIARPHKLKVLPLPELCECNFGFVEGLTFDEIKKRYPKLVPVMNGLDMAEPFPGGESIRDLDNRVLMFLEKLKDHQHKETVVVVAHGVPLRILICRLLGIEIKHWLQLRIDHASLSVIERYPGGAILNLLNDVSHLKS